MKKGYLMEKEMTTHDIAAILLLINMLGIAIIFGMTPRGMGDYDKEERFDEINQTQAKASKES